MTAIVAGKLSGQRKHPYTWKRQQSLSGLFSHPCLNPKLMFTQCSELIFKTASKYNKEFGENTPVAQIDSTTLCRPLFSSHLQQRSELQVPYVNHSKKCLQVACANETPSSIHPKPMLPTHLFRWAPKNQDGNGGQRPRQWNRIGELQHETW